MKITKSELIWLLAVVIFFILFAMPGVPAYHDPRGTIIHGLLTLLPLWLVSYIGMFRIYKVYKIRKETEAEDEKAGTAAGKEDDKK